MIRSFFPFFVIMLSVVPGICCATPISHTEMATDLTTILETRSSIDSLSGTGRTYVAFTQEYLKDLGNFSEKYTPSFWVFALRPTVDKSLSYTLHIQQYSLSCEIAALQILLVRLGVSVSEKDIIASIPHYPLVYASGGIWGDPDIEFVGHYTGGQAKRTGYGVYAAPLARYAQIFGLYTEMFDVSNYGSGMTNEIHMRELLQHLRDGDSHIILWGDYCTDPRYEDGIFMNGGAWILRLFPLPARNGCNRPSEQRIMNWTTSSGKKITGLSGEHAFVLLGYIGPIENPTHIIVWDTYTGRHVYPYIEWMRKWSLMQNRSLVISKQPIIEGGIVHFLYKKFDFL